MAKKQIDQALAKLLRSATQLNQKLTSQERFWLMRSGFVGRSAQSEGGFILPTVTLLLLMLSLVLGLLIFRTGNRSIEIIGEKQQRQVYNAATPAVERAKAKLEYLFTDEPLPALPSEAELELALSKNEPYSLDDETRIDLDGDGNVDNAWSFLFDSTGDGSEDTVVAYSILTRSVHTDDGGDTFSVQDLSDEGKADNLVVRNGPINLTGAGNNPNCPDPGRSLYVGWEQVTGSRLRKAIQVHAFARSLNAGNSTIATLEMQQDKQANLGNKWGAWFRYDMEIFPGPLFNWNGAMYTAGNYIVGGSSNRVTYYPISNDTSCVYTPDNSELAIGQFEADFNGGDDSWLGQYMTGSMKNNNKNGNSRLYLLENGFPQSTIEDNGAVSDSVINTGVNPADIALNPVLVLTEDINETRSNTETERNGEFARIATWAAQPWVQQERLYNKNEPTPFVDDTYRADSRWGPKPVYRKTPDVLGIPAGVSVSDPDNNEIVDNVAALTNEDLELVRDEPEVGNTANEQGFGLDGYWERRARAQGVRVIVGQRLELGNAFGWGNTISEDLDGDGSINNGEIDFNGDGHIDRITAADVESAILALGPSPTNAQLQPFRDYMALAGARLVDPLYPAPAESAGDGEMAQDGREHEQRQWKSLRDNLAAAQTTGIYHYLMSDGQYPVACLASAAHAGTEESVVNSTTFGRYDAPGGGRGAVKVDFLNGQGTNGLEFYPPLYATSTIAVTNAALDTAKDDFADAMNTATTGSPNGDHPMVVALSNLAYFSGDLAGAYPPFQDSDGATAANDDRFTNARDAGLDPVTHPYPIQTMWGDFSNLRRAIDKLESGVRYENLSLADRTTLQTAGCTLGMLAYNVDNVENNPLADDITVAGEASIIAALNGIAIDDGDRKIAYDGGDEAEVIYREVDEDEQPTGPELTWTSVVPDPTSQQPLFNTSNPATSIPPEILLKALLNDGGINSEEYRTLVAIHDKLQIQRDRAQGFSAAGYVYTTTAPQNVLGQTIPAGTEVRLQCDFEASDYLGVGDPSDTFGGGGPAVVEKNFLSVAFAVCPQGPKYPSLAYLFPVADHGHDGAVSAQAASNGATAFTQPTTEPYTSSDLALKTAESEPDAATPDYSFNNRYALNRGSSQGVNYDAQNDLFRVVGDDDGGRDGVLTDDDSDLSAIALAPKEPGAWALPNAGNNPAGRINKIVVEDTLGNEQDYWTALLDKGKFNGRESLALRVTDFDLDLLRRSEVSGFNQLRSGAATDFWLPLPEIADPGESATRTNAVIYAFREDTTREDAIARPRTVTDVYETWVDKWRDYTREVFANGYLMDGVGDGGEFSDPPVNPNNGLSPKAVDFYADPDRRPNGFRLRNGSDLRRFRGTTLVDENSRGEDELRGMSFISDAPVYIQGDFNVHRNGDGAGDIIEEYTTRLQDNWSNFFSDADRGQDDLEEDFARVGDYWRATEVIADAVTVLSDSYTGTPANDNNDWFAMDGWMKESWLYDGGSRDDNNHSSFRAFTRLRNDQRDNFRWVAEDGTIERGVDSGTSGLKVSLRGFPVYCAEPNGDNRDDLNTGDHCTANGGIEREFGLYDNEEPEFTLAGNRRRRNGAETRVNAVVVSGTVPSRAENSYGGLHNFPRFVERWRGPLRFAGSLFQLNFSSSATAPFDLDSWEPGDEAQAAEPIPYYGPPGRLWGYDVALQYVPAAPISERFSTRDNVRSEFYRELPADDPYIANLRCAPDPNNPGEQIDENAVCP